MFQLQKFKTSQAQMKFTSSYRIFKSRGVFRTLSNIKMERFVKKVNDWKLLNATRRALHLRCLTRFIVCLCYPGRKWEYTDYMKQWFLSEAYSESCKTSKIEHFAEIVNGFRPLTILGKRSFLDFWQGFEFVSCFCILCCVSFDVHNNLGSIITAFIVLGLFAS